MLKNKKNFLFDIDGTLAVDSTLYQGTKEFLTYIERTGGHVFYITNNSTKSRRDYVDKFKQWGIVTYEEQFVTASYATCLHLLQNYPDQSIYVLGTPSLVEEMRRCGIHVVDEVTDAVACVVIGFDTTLRYEKLEIACELLFRKHVDYIGTNPDYCCPTGYGFMPDCGSICQLINCTVGRTPTFIGKPNKEIVRLCMEQVGGTNEDTIVVGDRLYTDIACGINAGVETAVVYTGEATKEDVKTTEYPPTYQYDTIEDLYKAYLSQQG
ncbi:MAG: HAD-IIA family hydrolase [Lachnospiraceae bacterium]